MEAFAIKPRWQDVINSRVKLETRRIEKQVRDVVRSEILKVINGRQEAISPTSILNSIGLTGQQAETVERARQRLLAEGKLKGKALEKDLDKLRGKLLRERANLIAEHETRMAHALGQQAAWGKLFADKKLPGGKRHWHKLWVAADDERTCGTCMDLDGREVPVDEYFDDRFFSPPEPHPRCRCSVVLVETKPGWRREPDRGSGPEEAMAGANLLGGAWITKGGRHIFIGAPGGDATSWKKPPEVEIVGKWNLEKTGSLGGHSKAGIYSDENNVLWYVKTPDHADALDNEIIAGALYRAAGIPHANTKVVLVNGERRLASQLLDHSGSANIDNVAVKAGFATDAWLANWDVAGPKGDNILQATHTDGTKMATRIESGGALLYRGMGEPKGKAFGNTVGEIDSLRDTNKNYAAAYLFSNTTDADVANGIREHVLKVSPEEIDHIVNEFGGKLGELKNELAETLKARRLYLESRLPELDKSAGLPPIPGKYYNLTTGLPVSAKHPKMLEPKPATLTPAAAMACADATSTSVIGVNKASGLKWGLDNWDDAFHPRPDANGTPTNPNSDLYHVAKRHVSDYIDSWKGDAQSEGAKELRAAAKKGLGAEGMLSKSGITDDDPSRISVYGVKICYRETQLDLAAAGITDNDRIVLFRGVHKKYTANMAVEGYTTQKHVAKNWNTHGIYQRDVRPSSILFSTDLSATIHDSGYADEHEFFVLHGKNFEAGVFGSNLHIPHGVVPVSKPTGWGAKPLNLTDYLNKNPSLAPKAGVVKVPLSSVVPPVTVSKVNVPSGKQIYHLPADADSYLKNYHGKKYTKDQMAGVLKGINDGGNVEAVAKAHGMNESTAWMVAYNLKIGPYAKTPPAKITPKLSPHPWITSNYTSKPPTSISNIKDYALVEGFVFKKDTYVKVSSTYLSETMKYTHPDGFTPPKSGAYVLVPKGMVAPPGAKAPSLTQKAIAHQTPYHMDYDELMGIPKPAFTPKPPNLPSAASVRIFSKPPEGSGHVLDGTVWSKDAIVFQGGNYVLVKAGTPAPRGSTSSALSQDYLLANKKPVKTIGGVAATPPAGTGGLQYPSWLDKSKKYSPSVLKSAYSQIAAFKASKPKGVTKTAFIANLAAATGISESYLWSM